MPLTLLSLTAAVAVLSVATWAWLYSRRKSHLPKGFREVKTSLAPSAEEQARRVDCTKDSFSMKKVPKDLDAIIIGSGMGGLAAGAFLARAGRRVLVLEQHYVAGGCTHEFEDRGFSFDTGLHYVGNIRKYGMLMQLACHPDHQVEWAQMGSDDDGFVYDEIYTGGDDVPFGFPSGSAAYRDKLVEAFPEEEAGIDEWLAFLKAASDSADMSYAVKLMPRWLVKCVGPCLLRKFYKHVTESPWHAVCRIIKNKRLRAILLGQFGDIGRSPDTQTVWLHAGVVRHYMHGGFYPVGGPRVLAQSMIPLIEHAGGRVLVKAPVQEILVSRRTNRAAGVVMAKSGERIMAPVVISAAGAHNTFCKMLAKPVVEKLPFVQKIETIGPSAAHVYVFVGLNKPQSELKLPSSNLWHLPCKDVDYSLPAMMGKYENGDVADPDTPMLVFLGFPSAKDPTYNERHPGKSTCVLITEANIAQFEKWRNKRQGHRGEDYEALKNTYRDRMLDVMYKFYPATKGCVEYVDVATPLSSAYFLGNQSGESYGLAQTAERYLDAGSLRPDTSIPGLYLAGQDITSCGVVGGFAGGMLCAMSVLGYGLGDALCGRNMIYDMMNVKLPAKKDA